MRSLAEMAVFAKTVTTSSLSAAARELGVSTAAVSRKLASLEARLGVRLLNRTTRRIALTDEGARYYEACVRILAEIEEAEAQAAARRVEPQGILKVALPATFGHKHIAPLIPEFSKRYPGIHLALSLSDRAINVIDEGFDLAIRIAELQDSSLAARKLAPNPRVVCASPAYLIRHGTPALPADLARHQCLTITEFQMTWDYKDPQGKSGSVRVSGSYACDSWEVLREWAVAGLGIALKSLWDVRRELEDGSLVRLLPEYTFGSDVGIYAVYPHRRFLPAKTRVFIDFLAESFGPERHWDQPQRIARKPRSSDAARAQTTTG
jgi:DNA-binding transcriptional LysR family regulator